MTLFLVGMMGTGKTVVGKALASALNYDFIDLDVYLEKKTKRTISEIFQTNGEEVFRNMERDIKKDPFFIASNQVIATGGGFPLDAENLVWMKQKGIVIWLIAKPETIYQRIKHSNNRPLLPQPLNLSHIQELIAKRTFVYKQANYYIQTDNKSVKEIVQEILKKIDEKNA
ncbi:MAG: shikimate kinase [Candidatus Marinimicrobia bacterium]|nr:shikimate kinase [Candidatus Neomarinimicrobiota bacterium]MDD5582079.1 shikimate kinase [Candidatus Neomarinimicrobiota bacterium]